MPTFVFAVYDGATRLECALDATTLGYQHLTFEDEFGDIIDLESTPPSDPPVGALVCDDAPSGTFTIFFEPLGGSLTSGPLIEFDAEMSLALDLDKPGRHVVQQLDTPKIGFRIIVPETGAPVDVSTATNEIVFEAADGTPLKKTAALTSGGVDGRVNYQFQVNELATAGLWRGQAKSTFPDGSVFRSRVRTWEVLYNVPEP